VAEAPILSNLSNPLALAGLALVLPIILLYLLRPKPKLISFPTVMFIRLIEKNKRFTSFLQRFIQDPILLMQMLIIALTVLALANPFYDTETELRPDASIAIIVDASASMQATDISPSRFHTAIDTAKNLIQDLNPDDEISIILSKNIPGVAASNVDRENAIHRLSGLEASDTPGNLGDAIMLAKDMLLGADRERRIYVLSDFSKGSGLDPLMAKKIAQASGIKTQFIKTAESGENTGIVSLFARRSNTADDQLFLTASVRNYHDIEKDIKVRVSSGDTVLTTQEKKIAPGGEGFYYFKPEINLLAQTIKVEIVGSDDLKVDDAAYAHIPPVKINNVLLLSGENQDRYLRMLLRSLKESGRISFQAAIPPVTPDVREFDVIILGNAPAQRILPGMFRDIRAHVQSGATLIVSASSNLGQITDNDLHYILPVESLGLSQRESPVEVFQEHEILTDVSLNTITSKKHYDMQAKDGGITLAGLSNYDNPMITYRREGAGNVLYVGLNSDPEWSNLYYSSSFPIFWYQSIKYLTRQNNPTTSQTYHTGEYLRLDEAATVKTPSGNEVTARSLHLDKAGVYEIKYPEGTVHAPVNLLDPTESDIRAKDMPDSEDARGYNLKYDKVSKTVELYRHLSILAILLLMAEMLMYRRRGLI
jgi:hypothetical protein